MYLKRISIAGVAILAALGGCSAEHSAEGPAAASTPAAGDVSEAARASGAASTVPEAASTPGGAGTNPESRAFIDPATGQMRAPTAAELGASRTSASTEQAGKQQRPPPVERRLPNGTREIDMRDQPQVEEKVCVQADGGLGPCPAK